MKTKWGILSFLLGALLFPRPIDAAPAKETLARLSAAAEGALEESVYSRRLRLLWSAVNQLQVTEMPAIFDWVDAQPPRIQSALLESLFERWAELDPAGALKRTQAIQQPYERQRGIIIIIGTWAATDFKAALNATKQLPQGADRDAALQGMIMHAARKDLSASIDLIDSLASMDKRDSLYISAMFAPTNPAVAVALAARRFPMKVHLLDGLVHHWAEKRSDEALAWVETLPEGQTKRDLQARAIAGTARANPKRAGEVALSLAPGPARKRAIESVALEMSNVDPGGAVDWFKKLPSEKDQQFAIEKMGTRWAQLDPKAAATYAEKMPPGLARNQFLSAIARQLAMVDPPGALKWTRTFPASVREEVATTVMTAWAEADPQSAAVAALAEPPPIGERLVQQAVWHWALRRPEPAWAWAQKVSEPRMRDIASTYVVRASAYSDPAQAAQRLSALPPGKLRDESIQNIASKWSDLDAVAAAEWIRRLEPSQGRTSAFRELLPKWSRSQPKAAADYVLSLGDKEPADLIKLVATEWAASDMAGAVAYAEKLSDSRAQGAMFGTLALQWSFNDPKAAAEWASALPDDSTRQLLLNQILRQWSYRDGSAATNWVEQSSLPPAIRKQLLR